jgi:hypothetical protein
MIGAISEQLKVATVAENGRVPKQVEIGMGRMQEVEGADVN